MTFEVLCGELYNVTVCVGRPTYCEATRMASPHTNIDSATHS